MASTGSRSDPTRRQALAAGELWIRAKQRFAREPDPVAAITKAGEWARAGAAAQAEEMKVAVEPLRRFLRWNEARDMERATAMAARQARKRADSLFRSAGPRSVLDALRAKARNVAEDLPTPERWEAFFRREVLPAFNRLSGSLSRCEACGAPFTRRPGKTYCSARCSARMRGRGRNALKARAARHFEKCKSCKAGRLCPRGEALLPSSKPSKRDAFSRYRSEYRER